MRLPEGYRSWVEVYDYLKSKDVKYKTVRIQNMNINGEVTTRKLTLRTAERNAWREIQELRMDERQTMIAIHQLQAQPFYSELNQKASDLLFKLKINNNL